MAEHEVFELRRLSDDLIYVFDRHVTNGDVGYRRRDQDLWITYHGSDIGWTAYDADTQSVMGRPWNVCAKDQSADYPPEGEWVSKKGVKSYVYNLVYVEDAS